MNEAAIVIINWNNSTTTLNCIRSIKNNYNIIVVDNASINSELDKLKINLPKNVHLILNDKNLGFAVANNQGIGYAVENFHPDYIMLLNYDTIATPNFMEPLVSLMLKDPKIGAIQPKILRLKQNPVIDSAGQILYSDGSARDIDIGLPEKEIHRERKEIFGACAAAVLYRTSALKKTGLFDERLFILFEDVDISWRLRLKGYKIFYEPNSIIYHERGLSMPGSKEKNIKILQELYGFRNCLAITLKYYPLNYLIEYAPIHFYRLIMWLKLRVRHNIKIPFLKLIFSAIKERASIQNSPITGNIQRQWIVKVSYREILNIHK